MTAPTLDPVELEIVRNQLEGVAEEMGQLLVASAYSPNIKERRDCSTALFDTDGRLVAQAEHIPVHLGAMPEAVSAVRQRDPKPGDVWLLNDPFAGGTHLPDLTMVSPMAVDGERLGYAVSRAHHADVGGMAPGSMPAGAREIYQEGLRVPPVRIVEAGERNEELLSVLLANVRNSAERRADLRAQIAANERAAERFAALQSDHGRDRLRAAFEAVIDYSSQRMSAAISELPNGTYTAADVLEGDGISAADISIKVCLTISNDSLTVDFDGTAPQVDGNVNAPRSVTKSAVYFVVRAVTDPEIPPNHGCYRPVSVEIPTGSVLDPKPPAAVVGGNVETSQRVTETVLSAFAEAIPEKLPAQGQGTMNNLTIGSRDGDGFSYYETIGGGFGARPIADGMDGVQVGMTNTLNTPIEALEAEYPLRVRRYGLRPDSGGRGEYRGGLGIERRIEVDVPATVSLLTERRRHAPRGTAGGEDGATGENLVDGEPVGAKTTIEVDAGTTVTVRTPGGGGFGPPEARDPAAIEGDLADGKRTERRDDEPP
ncbi:hydantoinase B/oxoprolinase family protein [Halohasta salina]|uniref:hydantoinase B/oxoprolinase family protein n=1 Tax=Halohasta salina TaxID=2961621 RepID=UPI0020A3D7AB|nr:hydantoinase B/oxoprolinase family protein [Halohasta salina]